MRAFERLDEDELTKRFVFLSPDEFDIFFSGADHKAGGVALAWSEFRHSVGGRMIQTDPLRARAILADKEGHSDG